MSDDQGYDELEIAAAREQADRVATRHRTRAWLLSLTASAGVIALATTALSFLQQLAPPSRLTDADPRHVAAAQAREMIRAEGEAKLGAIGLPTGWVRGPVSFDPGPDGEAAMTSGAIWTTTWTTTPADDGALSNALAPSLTTQGWQRCIGESVDVSNCWQQSPYALFLYSGCPTGATCGKLSVKLQQVYVPVIFAWPSARSSR